MIGEQPVSKLREHSSMIITGINSEFSKSVFDVIHSLLGEQDTYMNSVFRVEELKSQMMDSFKWRYRPLLMIR